MIQEQIQWRNIQKVVKQLADFCFGSPNRTETICLGAAHIALVNSLTAKDGLNHFELEPLVQPNKLPVPVEEIGKILNEVMELAVKNGANSISMPDEYVAVAHFLAFPDKYY